MNVMETERKTTPGMHSNTSVYISSLLLITSGTVCVCVCVHLQSYQIQLVLSKAKGSGWGRVSDGQIAQCKRLADNSLICRFMCHRLDLFTIFPVSIPPPPHLLTKTPLEDRPLRAVMDFLEKWTSLLKCDCGTTEGRWKGKKSTLIILNTCIRG